MGYLTTTGVIQMILILTIYLSIGLALCYYNIHMECKVNRFLYKTKKDVLFVRPWGYLIFVVLWVFAIDLLTDIKDYNQKDS